MNKFFVFILFYWSFSAWAVAGNTKTELKPETKSQQEEITTGADKRKLATKTREEEEDFVPSLSDTLNDTNRLKSEIKRQLAENSGSSLKSDTVKRQPKGILSKSSASETAYFGDFEVNISERYEEDLAEVKQKRKKK